MRESLITTFVNDFRVQINATSYAGLFGTAAVLGLAAASLGPLIPLVREKYNISIATSGLTFLAFSTLALAGACVALFLVTKVQARIGLTTALVALSMGLAGIGLSPTFSLFLLAAALAGLGFGFLDVAINQVVGLGGGKRTPTMLLLMNSLFGVGAIFGPLLIAWAGIGALPFVLALVSLLGLGFVTPLTRLRGYVRTDSNLPPTTKAQKRFLVCIAFGFFFYIGVEAGVAGWLSTHLIAVGWSTQNAAAAASVFWVAFTLGRLAVLPLTRFVSPATITFVAMALTVPSMALAMTPNFTLLGYLLVGATCSPVFPMGIAWVSQALPGNPRATGLLVLVVMTGSAVLPFLTGMVIGKVGAIYAAGVLLLPAFAGTAVFWFGRRLSNAKTPPVTAISGGSQSPPGGSQSATGRD